MTASPAFLHGVAAFILFFELPIPIYWIILHPFGAFWRGRVRAAIWIAGVTAWFIGGVLLWMFRVDLFVDRRPDAQPSWSRIILGVALIAVEIYIFFRVERELGGRRLVGIAELTGSGNMLAEGLYAYVRHPRYTGMFCAVVGAALIAGTPLLWIVLAAWSVCALLVIRLEERELSARFGAAYDAYRNHVPAFLPLPWRHRK